jgi:uncharacterized protein DUF362
MLTYQSESSQWERSERCERLAPVIHIITTARRYTCAWYVAYLLQGTVTAGLLPIVLPLAVLALSHRLSWVADVLAAYNVGLLTCPLWGMVSEHTKAYRKLFLGSFLLAAGGIDILHWKGIQESILDLCATIPIDFVIADGIVAMEGNGPLNGTHIPSAK